MRRIADDFRPNAASITILGIGAGLLAGGVILAVAGIPGADGGSQTLFLLATVAALAAAVVGFLVNLRRDGRPFDPRLLRPNRASVSILIVGLLLFALGAALTILGVEHTGKTLLSTGIPIAALACAVGVVVNVRRQRE
ncbi:hypothetical protein [Leifsonia sp. PS1209]|uniref:hypothetical protein n=1 Tax=Leifsonia sp. PS1209 TaxID=2724914 RepID=UPI001442A723|nr:hypothetical protein [Leifsonia sp. PS1209]QJA00131.1 hypothetical protein HF024_17545 [Leifsonia sp. PS1209]